MSAPRNEDNAGQSPGNNSILEDIARYGEQKRGEQDKAKDPRNVLTSLLDQKRCVGDLISVNYNTAEVLIHDRLRQEVGGVPHGCLLLATRIKPEAEQEALDLDEPQTSLILLRALGSSPLPNDIEMKQARMEAGQRAAQTSQNWDEGDKTDQFTLNQMRYAGAHCRILGTFRMHREPETQEWQLRFGGDIDNFYAGQGMKVYKPAGAALEKIVNFRKLEDTSAEPVTIGKLRYAASIHKENTAEAVPVSMAAEDILAQRTALFGMTRTGKSNTTKTIASAVFRLRTVGNGQKVGQLIIDPNGEYANDNPQDQGCLRNLANIDGSEFEEDVVTYGLNEHPNDPGRRITKFNFFGSRLPGGSDAESKTKWDDALDSLYQGKQIIDDALGEETGGYVQNFINADITAPPQVDNVGERTRYLRALFVYKSILAYAGFSTPSANIFIKNLFGQKVRAAMEKDEQMKRYSEYIQNHPNEMPWDMAKTFCRDFATWVKSREFKRFDNQYAQDRNWSDERFLGLLRIFDNTRGLDMMQRARQWHTLEANTDYAHDIITHLREGRLVILDQTLGSPDMNRQAADRIMHGVFRAQQQAFINPERDESKEIKKPPPVIIYVEEAHTLLPRGSETDVTNIWARIAKEGAKFNIGLVYSTQEPSTIQPNILKNTENWFIAHLNNTDETRQLGKYYDFSDFTDSIIKVNETGFLRFRTLSSPYTLPVQIDKFTAPPPKQETDALPE